MNDEELIEEIKREIIIGRKNDVSAEGILSRLKELIPSTIIYKEKPLKTDPKILVYQKYWRENQKKIKQSKDNEIINQHKIEQALKRRRGRCFVCNLVVDVINPTYEIKEKKFGVKTINILFPCSNCKNIVTSFGGKLES